MNKLIPFLIACIIFVSCGIQKEAKDDSSAAVNVMAYYVPREGYMPDQLPLEQLTHIIFSFSKVIDGKMQFRNENADSIMKQLVAQKEKYPQLKVMIACGGWTADGFSDAVFSEQSRTKFIASTIDFIEKYQLDGVDIDWEYPAIPAGGTKARPEDKENFTLLMKGLREAMDQLDRPQTLTFASAGWKRYYKNVELLEVMKYVDYMNVMTYDQAGGGTTFATHHTALGHRSLADIAETPLGVAMTQQNAELPEGEDLWEPQSAEEIICFCVDKGVDPKQIVIGAAFYGRGWKGVPPENNGLYQTNTGPISGGTSYSVLLTDFTEDDGYEKHWDAAAKAPFLYNLADSIFVTFDDTVSVKLKTQYAKENNLGGIMFWQLSSDSKDEASLLKAIYTEASKK
ncbi:chitinase [Draconibacterium orientale]|uniref:chitinase n=1 Tax=Draconibacterium orientale TaxID=1168034 RepID=X5DI95_9BACT|nr:glycoside hydrolase family 18 protein [Draconibacterium orientale]AHW60227.1 chitinase [Draconibacterium orientale]SES95005.1 chitinase [Draconibacterium orientale]